MNRVSKTISSLLALAAVAVPSHVAGQTAVAPAPPTVAAESTPADEAIGNVLELIEVETKIATAARINADFVPGILTVLQGDDLEERGLPTVWEALASVPGITVAITGSGEKRVIVRGIGSTFVPSSFKMMLNGVSLNNSLSGRASVLFDIPTELVERIEIIRGPGAVVYGEYASAGVINVITRKGENRVFARSGSANTWGGGATLSLERPEHAFGISLNVAGWDAGDPGVTVEKDKLTGTQLDSFSRAPGATNEDHQNLTGVLAVHFMDFSLSAQFTESNYGDYYGIYQILPDADRGKVQSDGSTAVEAAQQFKFSPDTSARVKLGWLLTTRDWSAELYPAGVRLNRALYFPDGLFQNVYYRESVAYGETNFSAKAGRSHALLLGLGATDTNVVDADKDENGTAVAWIGEDMHRRLANVFLQDEFEATERLTITGGLRYDTYDDVGDMLTPRVSAVYRFQDRHIFKAQFAKAFRPPGFNEMVGYGPDGANPDIEPELTRTYEVGYIFKNPANDARLTLFHSKIDGLIVSDVVQGSEEGAADSLRYSNIGKAAATGGELELLHRFGRKLTADANVSYVKTEDNDSGEEIAGAASWLGNLSLIWRPYRQVSLAAVNRYVGKRHRASSDTRGDLKGYDTVDLVINLVDLPIASVTVRAGLKNVFDADVRYPTVSSTLEDDLVRPGRQWWVQVSYAF